MPLDSEFKLLLESLTTAVLLVDESLNLQYLNPAAEVLLGVSRSQVMNLPLTAYIHEDEDSFASLPGRSEALENYSYTKRQVSWRLANGQTLTVDYSLTSLPEQQGILIEVQHLDRLLRISREEATTSAQETTRNLVRGLAHEIKNPLGGIRGAAQLMAREFTDKKTEEYTRIIIQEADRLRNLVDKMMGPHQTPTIEPVNIHEVTERVAAVISAESGGKLVIERDYDPSIPPLPGDKEQLIQAILNIVRNAWEALEDAGMQEEGNITIRTRVQRQFTIGRFHHNLVSRIDIVDNGPGVPAELIEEIFYPMISGRAKGTGLGLSISQQLISQHMGLIDVESRPGRTQFSVYIPMTTPITTSITTSITTPMDMPHAKI
jgi:two-component system nitrogen regulation sensor histidine kinase GlnL